MEGLFCIKVYLFRHLRWGIKCFLSLFVAISFTSSIQKQMFLILQAIAAVFPVTVFYPANTTCIPVPRCLHLWEA